MGFWERTDLKTWKLSKTGIREGEGLLSDRGARGQCGPADMGQSLRNLHETVTFRIWHHAASHPPSREKSGSTRDKPKS